MIKYKFSKNQDTGFSKTLISRVNAYFKENKLDKQADAKMLFKTFFAFGFYLSVYFLILFGGISNLFVLFLLFGMLGLGQAFIGMAVMHDAVHLSYTKNKYAYGFLQLPIVLIGVESLIWKIEHNVLHHNYTNIENIDQDIHPRYIFRFSKNQPQKWFHRYQHLYATFIYSLMIIEWITVKDFIKVFQYRKTGIIKTNREAMITGISILLKKAAFYLVFLFIPLIFLELSTWTVVALFFTMVSVSGLILTLIFQTAHVVPECDFVNPTGEAVKENWHVHQMRTTSNFAVGNKWVTYFVGALNYQIEHHLFPGICHVHYPKISEIIRTTAEQFGVPYYSKKNMWKAISDHYSHLNAMGKGENKTVSPSAFQTKGLS